MRTGMNIVAVVGKRTRKGLERNSCSPPPASHPPRHHEELFSLRAVPRDLEDASVISLFVSVFPDHEVRWDARPEVVDYFTNLRTKVISR
jgi:hypothetical protein